jgi:hypothetical protein
VHHALLLEIPPIVDGRMTDAVSNAITVFCNLQQIVTAIASAIVGLLRGSSPICHFNITHLLNLVHRIAV